MLNLYLNHKSAEKSVITPSVEMLSTKSDVHKEEDLKVLKRVAAYVDDAVVTDSAYYRLSLTKLPPVFIGNRSDINRFYEKETEDWLIGGNTRFGLIFLDPRLYSNTAEEYNFAPQTGHIYSEDRFLKTVKHEVGHVYFGALLGTDSRRPFLRWLNEGTQYACAGQMTPDKALYEKFDPSILEGNTDMNFFYRNSATAVMRLTELYGPEGYMERLHALLRKMGHEFIKNDNGGSTNLEKVYRESFLELFGFEPTKDNMTFFVKTGQIPEQTNQIIY